MRIIGPVRIDGIWDGAIDAHTVEFGLALQPDHIVVLAVAGRGVDEASTSFFGDVVTCQHRHGKPVIGIKARQGVGADRALRIESLNAPPACDHRGLGHIASQLVGDDQPVTRLGPRLEGQVADHGLNLIEAIGDGGIVTDRPVSWDGPWCCGPDHHARAHMRASHHRKLDPNRRAIVVVIFHLGVG